MNKSQKTTKNSPEQFGKKINTYLTIFLILAAIIFVYLTCTYYCDDILQYKYTPLKDAKFKKTDQKIKALTDITFYCTFILCVIYALKCSTLWFTDKSNYHSINAQFKNKLVDTVQETVVFLGLYTYILFHRKADRKQLILYATWFLSARVYLLISELVQKKIVFNVKEFGSALIVLNYILMIGEIVNLQPFQYI